MGSNTDNFNSVISSGEMLCKLATDLNITELEEKMPEYTKAIQQYFVNFEQNECTQNDFDDLKKIVSEHKIIIDLFNSRKEEISKKLKQVHVGKTMQDTYPNTNL
jgi:hypothetical protein